MKTNSLSGLFLFIFLISASTLTADEKQLQETFTYCSWGKTSSELLRKNSLTTRQIESKDLINYENYLLTHLKSIDSDALKTTSIYVSEKPTRDFLFYNDELLAVSQRNEPSSVEEFQNHFALLKKKFGSPKHNGQHLL
jgi:hypothetical protein